MCGHGNLEGCCGEEVTDLFSWSPEGGRRTSGEVSLDTGFSPVGRLGQIHPPWICSLGCGPQAPEGFKLRLDGHFAVPVRG